MSAELVRALRVAAQECDDLAVLLEQARERRDALALRLVDAGKTWREVASIAGFANHYIAALKRRAAAAVSAETPGDAS